MNKKSSVTSVEHEIARLHFLNTMRLNAKAIARPQCGQHADSAGSHLQVSRGLKYLGSQIAFARFPE